MSGLTEKVETKIEEYKKNKEGKLIWIAEDWHNKEFNRFIEQFGETPPQGIVVADGRNDLIRVDSFAQDDLMVKKFNLTRNYDKLRFCLLDSKAVRSLRIALALEEIGVQTPKPIAVVEERGRFNQLLYSYYLTEYVDYDYNLLHIVADDDHPRRKQVKELLPGIAKDVRRMHDAGIVHNDLHAGNILIKDMDSNPEFYYIDLNRGRIKGSLSDEQRMKDLARFEIREEEKKIFIKNYSPQSWVELFDLMKKQRQRRKAFREMKRKIRNLFRD